MKNNNNITLSNAAIFSGTAILVMTVAAVIATDLSIGTLTVTDNAAATTNNIMASKMLFRLGVFSWLIVLICDVLAAWGLYIFLKPVNKYLSLLMAWLRLVYVAILGISLLNYIKVLLLINSESFMSALGMNQFQSEIFLLIKAFENMWSFGLIIFGLHVLLLGYLAFKSGYIPKIFGILLIIAFVGYIITNLGNIFVPTYRDYKMIVGYIFIIPMLSEVALGFWLLIKGRKVT